MNTYTVRYQLDGDEHTDQLDAENAATAAREVEERHLHEQERFELIEVHLVSESSPGEPANVQEQPA
jgi:hypothetical protein